MEIIESFTLGKKDNSAENEDGIYLGNRFFAVIDGVTSKLSAPEKATMIGGCFACGKIMESLENAPDELMDPVELLIFLNDGLKKKIEDSVFRGLKEPPAASLILYDQKTQNVISYGDCQMLYLHQVYKRGKMLDAKHALMRSKILKSVYNKVAV